MKVIAEKKAIMGFIYLIAAVVCLVITILSIEYPESDSNNYKGAAIMLLSIPLILALYLSFKCFSLPKELITLNENNELVLPDDVVIKVSDIVKVTFKRARARGRYYKYGTLKIQTLNNTYKVSFVRDVETVSQAILTLKNNEPDFMKEGF